VLAPARDAVAGMRQHLPTNHPGRAHMLSMLADALVNQWGAGLRLRVWGKGFRV